VFSCSESEQKQLNTWVSFQSAEQPLLGQFSVSGNRLSSLAACPAPQAVQRRLIPVSSQCRECSAPADQVLRARR